MPFKHFSTRTEVSAVEGISVTYAFPAADEDISDNRGVKYEQHFLFYLGEAPCFFSHADT